MSPTQALPTTSPRKRQTSAWYALGVLTLVTLFAFVDRGVLVLQAEVIRKAFSLSDLQLGLLQGTGVAIFAALASYPLGWLADRFDRRVVLAGSVIVWSAAVVATGFAQNYEQLLLASAMVGAGEAGLVPIVYALIPDLFPPKSRQTANSIYALSSTVGSGLALALTGQLIGSVDGIREVWPAATQGIDGWRLAMFAAAAPAPLMVMFIFTIVMRRRADASHATGATSAAAASTVSPSTVPLLAYAKQQWPAFAHFFGAMGLTIFGMQAVGGWMAVIYLRVFGQTPQQVGAVLGVVGIAATGVGFLLSIWLVRRFTPILGVRLHLRIMACCSLVLALSFAAMVFATSAYQMYAIQGFYTTLLTTGVMVLPTITQGLAPGHLRARATSISTLITTAGGAAAPPVTGLLSDQFKHLPNGLMLAAALIAAPCLLLAALLFYRGERWYEKTAEAVRRIDDTAA